MFTSSVVGLCLAMLTLGVFLKGCESTDKDIVSAAGMCSEMEETNTPVKTTMPHVAVPPNFTFPTNLSLPTNFTLPPTTSYPNLTATTKSVLQKSLQEFIGSSAFLSGISAAKNNIPDRLEFNVKGTMKDEVDAWGYCKLSYVVGASIEECSGMKNMDVKVASDTAFEESASGHIFATIPMTISAGPVSCTGHACASGNACGLSFNPAVVVKPSLSVSGVNIKAVMSLASGSGENKGKICLEVERVLTDAGEFVWGNLDVNLSGMMFSVPEDVLQQLWQQVPLDEVNAALNGQLSSTIKGVLGAMVTCFDVPEISGLPVP